jgi:hypothetical protein
MRLQNTSGFTVTDYLTQQQAEPDGVIEVDDDLRENYENHPMWAELPSLSTGDNA